MDAKESDSAQKQESAFGERRQFTVFIVESPSCNDFYNDTREGEILKKILHLSGLRAEYKVAVNKKLFKHAMTKEMKQYLDREPGWFPPILHISGHGNEKGIGFTVSDDILSWNELRELIIPINRELDQNLVVCLSLCKGMNACVMAMQKDDPPFHALVSNTGEPLWSDTAIAFAAFYHQLAKGSTFSEAEKAMQAASGDAEFQVHFGEEIQHYYNEVYLERVKELQQRNSRQ